MRTYRKLLAVIALSGLCFAAAAPSENEGAVKKSKKHPAKTEMMEAKPPCEACEAVKRLEEKVAAQQAEIDALKAAQAPAPPATNDEEARAAAAAAKRAADEAAAAAAAAAATANNANTAAAGAQASAAAATEEAANAAKKAAALEEPAYVHYKGVRIYPGGYGQVASIYRTHNANSDTASNFNAYPLSGSTNSHVNEWRESGRGSRLTLRVEGEAKRIKMLGYVETDFLGTTPNASESLTNSFSLRLRIFFGSAALPGGWRITGGQTYSLMTPNRVAADPLTEALPAVIDNSFYTGFAYARQGTFRVSKSIGNHAWLAIAAENPETVATIGCLQVATTGAAVVPASCSIGGGVQGLQNTALTSSPLGGNFASTATPSNDVAPDLMAKVVVEPGWGHFEVVALGRFFRDRFFPSTAIGAATPVGTGHNQITEGGGLGFNAVLPVVPKKVDVILHVIGGKGIGRYGSAGGPDVTVNGAGELVPIKGLLASAGIEVHPTPKFDFYVYGGDEYYGKTNYTVSQTVAGITNTYVIGYGAQQFLNGGCNTEFPSATATSRLQCQSSAQNRNLWEVTPGFWYRIYKGKEGTVQFGAQYAYNYRRTWTGQGAVAGTLAHPIGVENTVMTAFRYYLP